MCQSMNAPSLKKKKKASAFSGRKKKKDSPNMTSTEIILSSGECHLLSSFLFMGFLSQI